VSARLGRVLPDHILTKMAPADRRELGKGGKTAAECRAEAVVRDEKDIQKQVGNYLRLLNLWHDQDGMHKRRTGTIGAPDFQFPYRGRYVAWEVKCAWSRSLRPEQQKAADAIEKQGGRWRLITSLADAQGHLREIDGEDAGSRLLASELGLEEGVSRGG
jgi:hypothetical protein